MLWSSSDHNWIIWEACVISIKGENLRKKYKEQIGYVLQLG
jgi:hypothetical protein